MVVDKTKLFGDMKSFFSKPFLLALIAIILSDQSLLLSLNINMHTFSVILYLTGLWAIIITLIFKEKIDLDYINRYILILFALFLGKSILYIMINSINIFFLVPLILNFNKVIPAFLKDVVVNLISNYAVFIACNKIILYIMAYANKVQLTEKIKGIDRKIIYLVSILIIMFLSSAVYFSNYKLNHLTQKDIQKIENKINKMEKSDKSPEKRLKTVNDSYEILAKANPNKYLGMYLKSTNELVEYYFKNKSKIEAGQLLDKSIKFYENIIYKNPEYINIEAYKLYKSYFDYYRVRYKDNKGQKYLDEESKQVNYLLEKDPNNIELLDKKRDILWWSRTTLCNLKTGNPDRCLEVSKQQVEVCKKYSVQFKNSVRLTQSLDDYIPLLIKRGNIDEANKTYDGLINYFETLSKSNPKFKIYIADLLIHKNEKMYDYLTNKEITQNFAKAQNLLLNNYKVNLVDDINGLQYAQYQLIGIARIYESKNEIDKAEQEYLITLNIYKKLTLKDIENIKYLKYRYLDLYEAIIKFYTKNQMNDKAHASKNEARKVCSYFMQNDSYVTKYNPCASLEY